MDRTMEWSPPQKSPTGETSGRLRITAGSYPQLLEDITAHFRAGRGFCLATLNLDHVVKLRRDQLFRQAYAAHSHVTADGNPIVWLSRLAGDRIDLIPGADLIDPLCAQAAAQDVPVALLGSTEDTLNRAAEALRARHAGLRITALIAPPMGFAPTGTQAASYVAALENADIRLCFLALGAPKQEVFASFAAPQLPKTGFVSIGAGLDFIAGTQQRAPAIVRRLALEWLWRMMHNPTRLAGRYLSCILILPGLTISALRCRWAGKGE